MTADGTLGGYSFAVSSKDYYNANYMAYRAFDATSYFYMSSSTTDGHWYTMYNPEPIKVSSIAVTNYQNVNYALRTCIVRASNDNANWTTLTTVDNTVTAISSTWTIDIPTNVQGFYKYYQLYDMMSVLASGNYVAMKINLTATYMYTLNDPTQLPVVGTGKGLGIYTTGSGAYSGAWVQNVINANYGGATVCVAPDNYINTGTVAPTIAGLGVKSSAIGVVQDPMYSGLAVDVSMLNSFEPYFYIRY